MVVADEVRTLAGRAESEASGRWEAHSTYTSCYCIQDHVAVDPP
jgi:hypothetical protein